MKIALAQINPTVGDFSGNTQKILSFAERAGGLGADLVLFPELSICGYPPADLLEKDSFVARAEAAVRAVQAWTAVRGRPAILCGSVMPTGADAGKRVRNVAVLLAHGEICATQAKTLLPFYDVFDEQRYFEPADAHTLAVLDGRPLAITVCEDMWNDKGFWPRRRYTLDPVESLMAEWDRQPPELARCPRILLNISASPFWGEKRTLRREMLLALAERHQASVFLVNQVGGNDSLIFDGTSLAVSAEGHVLAEAKSFAEDLVLVDTALVDTAPIAPASNTAARDDAAASEIAATWDALVLGTRDYVQKCGFKKALVGLSGGIDSALVAAIAVAALGAENVVGVGMPSEFSSTGSIDDARALAANLAIRFEVLAIHEVFSGYMDVLGPVFAGTPFGLAEENLQARIRGALLMAMSNKFGALVLTTGNKSEMATGYCTLYGDMVGGLAVIGDVWKTRVYQLCAYSNREREVIPQSTLTKPPSAELRPGQKDTDSLPPYDVLDPILEAYVERYRSAEEISADVGADLEQVRAVLKLVERSEYKRQQAAPVLKVTRKSFGNGRRFPIAVKVEV